MVAGMKDWVFWLLVGLAIFPMLIPVQRRYQVLRLRHTAARMRGLQNAVPARLSFKETRSPYLTLRGMKALHLERRGNSRVWFVLTITNLIVIPLLAVLTGIAYYRISPRPPHTAADADNEMIPIVRILFDIVDTSNLLLNCYAALAAQLGEGRAQRGA
jgi:hypothetical protein